MTTFEDRYGILALAAGNNLKKELNHLPPNHLEEDMRSKKQQNNIKMQRKEKRARKYGKS